MRHAPTKTFNSRTDTPYLPTGREAQANESKISPHFNPQAAHQSGKVNTLGNGTTTTGIAYYNSSSRQIGVITLNTAKTEGLIYIGTR